MKFLFAFAVLFIGAVSAQVVNPAQPANNNRVLVESLEKRAAALHERVKQVFVEHQVQNPHLLQELSHQSILVEALALDLKAQLADQAREHHLHHIHVIEEELLSLENRVSEEIEMIHHFAHNHQGQAQTGPQLIGRAEQLVKNGKEAQTKYPQAKEVQDISREIIVVEALVKSIQAKPSLSADELKKNEQELAKHEQSLQQLIEKASARRN